MLKPQITQLPHPAKTHFLLHKPLVHGNGNGNASFPISRQSFQKKKKNVRVGFMPSRNIKDVASSTEEATSVKATVTVKVTVGGFLSNLGIDRGLDDIKDLIGKTLHLELVSAELDLRTGVEKETIKGYAQWASKEEEEVKYESSFEVPADFGEIGAVLVENEHHKEKFLKDIILTGFPNGPVHINCSSWVHSKFDNPHKRVFFTSKSYLPPHTPSGLRRLREEELVILRGNGQGERKSFERVYDYDVYNDLGDLDSSADLKRPVLGGKDHSYPRRCRTGRPRTETDPLSEKRSSGTAYVPRDESFSEEKRLTFSAKTISSVLPALVPSLQTAIFDSEFGFPNFTAIDSLFNEGVNLPPIENQEKGFLSTLLPRFFKAIADSGEDVLRFETTDTMDRDKFFWFRDEEFARQTLAGVNPYSIQLVTEWPLKSKLDPKIYGPPESAISTEMIEREIKGLATVEEAINQKKLFILDYHDLFLPYVSKVRQTKGTTLYGSRTLFFLTPDGTLRPLAIELTRPPMDGKPQWKQVFMPCWNATGVWLWRLAKAHVLAHDSGHHQLINHWGMAVEDPTAPHGLKLTIEDYPFANDGLVLWDTIKEWVSDYVSHYYPNQRLIESDQELQAWWTEIRTVGHGDKKDEPWWPILKTPKDLIEIITTIAWVTSGHHAAVNFGQYSYTGYFPNRPTIARTNMPTEEPSEESWDNFLRNPEGVLLECFPSQIQATRMMAVMDILSNHSPDEEYLGDTVESAWVENPYIKGAFERFKGRLMKLEGIIDERNANKNLLNRSGAGIVPYELLKPFSPPGVTGKGVPYSISI
ncbi:linoleate 13S-lipoxygenase 2-1, chloroplastic-like isoform X2 [Alnus glutinosa]|uniref:linoleate 13S-lipoxygenase 2-1, chloroplastic-like isoform X2 n=1 Tax=Alnus glutinosa TaxID=3517 RepID=UPI002D79025C|nr:linoleate 13S-lipoxygenase 2-1, chloroplastic-like isoform X2 [Alnus glutinosa]